MFTGLVEIQGAITAVRRTSGGAQVQVSAPSFADELALGDSVAVNGACLTVTQYQRGVFTADVSAETLEKTTLGTLRVGEQVNLERALRLSDRLGGHIVSGHIDGVGRLLARHGAGNSTIYTFEAPAALLRYIVPKGSFAVDGISLTVADTGRGSFSAAVIPHTEQSTTLGGKAIGAAVNLEVDVIAKYVERFVSVYAGAGGAAPDAGRRSLEDLLHEFTEGR